MFGIIIKDFYESFCIKKNLLGFIFSLLLFFVMIMFLPNLYAFILSVVVTLPMTSVSPLQYSMEQDEISEYDKILLTFPLTKKEIVISKLIGTYIFGILMTLVVSIPVTLLYVYGHHVTDIHTGLLILFCGIIVSLIMLPINNIGFFWLGNKKGTILYIIIVILFVLGYINLHFLVGIETLLKVSITQWLIIGVVIAFIFNIAGYFLCMKIYLKKHS